MVVDLDSVVRQSRASQNKVELAKVLKYVEEIHPQVIVEIGVHQGYSMEVWQKAFNPKVLIGIDNDLHDFDQESIKDPAIVLDRNSHKKETAIEMMKILADSNAGFIDFLFIDGDHTYEGVEQDYALYAPFVRSGGIIGFHDVALNSNEYRMAGVDVQRFWNKVIAGATSKYLFFWDEIGKGTGTGLLYKK